LTETTDTAALRSDGGKERVDMIPVSALMALARVYEFGATKYEANNWRRGQSYTRCYAALLRHLYRWAMGQDNDEESGHSHLLHVAFWAFALWEWQRTGAGKDDRVK
jgi:hypothetical protein